MKRKKKKSRIVPMVILIFLLLAGVFYWQQMTAPVQAGESETLVVPKNATTTQIAGLLAEQKLIRSPLVFKLYARLNDLDGRLKAGTYTFSGTVSLEDLKKQLLRGHAASQTFTIPEGYTVEEIAKLLNNKGLADSQEFLSVAEKSEFAYDYLPKPGTSYRLEGFLFPDTYQIPKGYSEKQIIQMMLARFDQIMTEEWRLEAKKLKMDMNQVVTLASIIEREARVAKDRSLVSSVFHNRLKIGMQLESCATVQFALGEVKEVLLYEDLEIDSPYNTYRNDGLPPGPIAAPGAAALKAALYPAETDYLFFVAKKDGSHYFSKTLAEHNRAKAKYLK